MTKTRNRGTGASAFSMLHIAALSPANPPPKILMLVFFIRPPRLPTIVDAVAGLTFHGELQRHLSFYLSLPGCSTERAMQLL